MPALIATIGLPASGKTTLARAWVAEDPQHRTRVNRDDIRGMFGCLPIGSREQEEAVTIAQHAAIVALLQHGMDVIVDDTNLRPRTMQILRTSAQLAGADVQVLDLTDVPVDVCIARDVNRGRPVGEQVIRGMHARYLAGHDAGRV
jgi:predicted kinase